MALVWKSIKESLHHEGRFFHAGDTIPAKLLTQSRLDYFKAKGMIVDEKSEQVKTEEKPDDVKPGKDGKKKSKEKPDENVNSEDDLK